MGIFYSAEDERLLQILKFNTVLFQLRVFPPQLRPHSTNENKNTKAVPNPKQKEEAAKKATCENEEEGHDDTESQGESSSVFTFELIDLAISDDGHATIYGDADEWPWQPPRAESPVHFARFKLPKNHI